MAQSPPEPWTPHASTERRAEAPYGEPAPAAETATGVQHKMKTDAQTEQQRLERSRAEDKKRLKRAANRRSARTSRVRKKQFVEEMTAQNAQLQLYSTILARAPPTVTVDENCRLRFASQQAKDLLGITSTEDVDLRSLLADGPDRNNQAQWLARATGCAPCSKRAASPPSASSPSRDAAWPPREWSSVRRAVSNSSGDSGGSNSDRRGESSSNNGSSGDNSSGSSHDGSDDDSREKVDTQVPRAPGPRCTDDDVVMGDRGASSSHERSCSSSSRDGSTQSDDQSEGDLDACRLELVCRDGRVVSVDAARGGAFAACRETPVVEDDRPRRARSPVLRPPSSPADFLTRSESHDSLATNITAPPPGPRDARETVLSLRPAYEYDDTSAWLGSLTVGPPHKAEDAQPGATVRKAVAEAVRGAHALPKVEELCADTDASPADLQSVVDGLMLIAGAAARAA